MAEAETVEITQDSPEFRKDVATVIATLGKYFEDYPGNKIQTNHLLPVHKVIMTELGISAKIIKKFSNTESHVRANIYKSLKKVRKGDCQSFAEKIVRLKYSEFREKNRESIDSAASTTGDVIISGNPTTAWMEMSFRS
jgi:hypothetical protein